MNTIFVGQANKIHLFNRFVNEKYPDLNSLTDLYFDKANKKMLSLKGVQFVYSELAPEKDISFPS